MDQDWARLAAAVQAARPGLKLDSHIALLEAIGVSDKTLRRLMEEHLPLRQDTLRKIERGLGWTPYSANRVLAGDEPTRADSPTLVDVVATGAGAVQVHEPTPPPARYYRLHPQAKAAIDAVIEQLPIME
jgi:hypothetical protein